MEDKLSDAQKEEILAAIVAGRKIEAIKIYREGQGVGLKEAKEVIEQWEQKLRAEHPDQMSQAKSGCSTVILAMLGVVLAAMLGLS